MEQIKILGWGLEPVMFLMTQIQKQYLTQTVIKDHRFLYYVSICKLRVSRALFEKTKEGLSQVWGELQSNDFAAPVI